MGKQNNGVTYVSQAKFDKDLNSSVDILINDGVDENTIKEYIKDYKSRFAVSEKKNSVSTATSEETPSVSPVQQKKQNTLSVGGKPLQTGASASSVGKVEAAFGKQIKSPIQEIVSENIKISKERKKNDISGIVKQKQVSDRKSINADEAIIINNNLKQYVDSKYDPSITNEKLASEKNEFEFWDGVKEGARKAYNTAIGIPLTIANAQLGGNKNFSVKKGVPLAEEKIQAEKELNDEFGKGNYSPALLQRKAEEIFVKKDKLSQNLTATDEYFSSLPKGHEIKEEVEMQTTISNIFTDKEIKSQALLLKKNTDVISSLNKLIEDVKLKGFATEEEKSQYEQLLPIAQDAQKENELIRVKFSDNVEKLKTDKEKLELLKYNYNDFDKSWDLWNKGVGTIIGGALRLTGETQELVYDSTLGKITGKSYEFPLSRAGKFIQSLGEEDVKQYRRLTLDDVNTIGDVGNWFGQLSVEQGPIVAAMALTGQAGLATVSMSSGGQQIYELEEREKQPFSKKYSQLEKVASGWLYTAAEYFPERYVTFKYLDDLKKSISSISTESRQLVTKNFAKSFAKGLAVIPGQAGLEGLSEDATELTTILTDIYLLGDELSSNEMAKRLKEAGAAGIAIGGGMSVTGVVSTLAAKQLRAISDNADIKEVNSILDELNKINQELEANELLTEKDKSSLEGRAQSLSEKAFKIVSKSVDKLTTLSEEEITTLLDINKEQYDLKKRYDELKKSAMSSELKKKEYEELDSRFKQVESKRNDILKGTYSAFNYLSETEEKSTGINAEQTTSATEQENVAQLQPQEEVDVIDIPEDEILALEKSIEEQKIEGTLSENINQKGYMGNKEGMIKIDDENQNTIVFETNDEIIVLGKVDSDYSTPIASFGISKFPVEGVRTEGKEGVSIPVVSVDGKEYQFISRARDKKGEAVVKIKEKDTGLIRRIKGDAAERILKDVALQLGEKESPLNLKLTTVGVEEKTEKELKAEQKKRNSEERKARREEFQAKTLQQLEEEEKKSEELLKQIEADIISELESKTKDKGLVKIGERVFQVSKKKDGTYAVSQMRQDGKLVGIRDAKTRENAISEFNKTKKETDEKAFKEAQDLIDNFRKVEKDRIEKLLDKAVESLNLKGKGAFDASIALPAFVAKKALEVVRAAYKAGKTLSEAIKDGYNFINQAGYSSVSEFDFNNYVLDQLTNKNKKETKDAVQEQSTDEGLLQPEQPEVGLQEMGQRDDKQEVTTKQGTEKEIVSKKELSNQVSDLFAAAKEALLITKNRFNVIDNLKKDLNKFVKANLVGLDSSDISKSSIARINSIIQNTNDKNFEEQTEKINDIIDELYLRKELKDEKALNKKVKDISKDTFYKDKSSSKVTKTKVTDEFKKKIEQAKEKFTKIVNPTIADKTAFVIEMNGLLRDGVRARKSIDDARKEKSNKNANKLAIIALKKDGKVSPSKKITLNKDSIDKAFSRGGVIFNGKVYLNTKSGRTSFENDTNGLPSADVSSVSVSTTVSNAEQSRKSIRNRFADALKWYSTSTFSANKFFEPLYSVKGAKEFIAKNFNDPLKVYSEKISRKVSEFRGIRDSFIKDIIGSNNFISSKGLSSSKVLEVLKTAASIYKGKAKGNPLWAFVGKNEIVFSAKIGNDVVNGTYQEIIDLFDEAIKLDSTLKNQKVDFQNKYIPFDNMKNEGVAALFNMIRQPDGIAKFLNSYSMEDAKAIIEYVNSNPKIREVADKSTKLFESIRDYVNPTLDKLGYDTLGESKYIPREQALAALEGKDTRSTEDMYELLDLIYPNGLPENIPYYPLSADALAGTNDGNFIEFFENDDSENPNADYSLLFPSLFTRKAGGNLNLNNLSITGSFDNISKDAITLVEGSDIVNDVRSVYANEGSNVSMVSSFGKNWNEDFKKKVLNIVKDNAYENSSKSKGVAEKALNAWVVSRSLLRAGQLSINTFSSASQLTGIFIAYSKEGNFKYMKQTINNLSNSSTRKAELESLKKAYKAMVASANYIERANKRKDNADVSAIKSVNDNLGYRVAGATLSDLLFLTTLFDQISLIALAPIYKGKYVSNEEYNNPDNMDMFFAEEVNKSLQSNAPYYTGTAFYSKPGLFLGLGGYLQSPRQIAELITEDVKSIARKEGDYASKSKRIIALGSFGLILPVFLKDMLRGFDDDNDEEESKADKRTSYLQTANKLSDSMLEAFGFGGTVISAVKNSSLTKYSPDVMEMNVNPSDIKAMDVFGQVVKGASPNISITLRGIDDMIDRKEIYTTADQFAFGAETTFGFPAAKIKKQIDYMVAAGSEQYDYKDYWDLFSGKVTQAEFKEYETQLNDFRNTLDKAVYPKNSPNGTLNTSFLNKKQLNELSKMSFENKAEYIEDIRMNLMRKSIVEQVESFKKSDGIDKGKGYYKVRESKIKEDLSDDVYELLKNKYYSEDNVVSVDDLRVKLKGFIKDNNISEETGNEILKESIKKAKDKIMDEITLPIVKQIKNYNKGRDRAKFIYNNIGDLKIEDKVRYIQLMGDDFDEDTQNEYLNIVKSNQ